MYTWIHYWKFPLFQKQLIRFEPESVRSTEDELINGVPQDNCSWKDECYRDSRSWSQELKEVPNVRYSNSSQETRYEQWKSESKESFVVVHQRNLLREQEFIQVGSQREVEQRKHKHEVNRVADSNDVV